MGDYYAFPTREALLSVNEEFFTNIGAGYRAKYLYETVRLIDEKTLKDWDLLSTPDLKYSQPLRIGNIGEVSIGIYLGILLDSVG